MAGRVYTLQSRSTGGYYCGQISDLERRLAQHNDPADQLSKTTKRQRGPWALVWAVPVETGSEAVILERRIKRHRMPSQRSM